PIRERDTALVALAYPGGFRRAELVALDLADYDRDSGRLRVVGKGNKERAVFVSNGARDALHAWLRVRGPDAGPLLLPVGRHGHVLARRLTEQTVYDRLRYLAERAGVAAFSPHDCRRSLVGDLLDAGVDLATVQAMLGHASPATTARYDRRGERVPCGRRRSDPRAARGGRRYRLPRRLKSRRLRPRANAPHRFGPECGERVLPHGISAPTLPSRTNYAATVCAGEHSLWALRDRSRSTLVRDCSPP